MVTYLFRPKEYFDFYLWFLQSLNLISQNWAFISSGFAFLFLIGKILKISQGQNNFHSIFFCQWESLPKNYDNLEHFENQMNKIHYLKVFVEPKS